MSTNIRWFASHEIEIEAGVNSCAEGRCSTDGIAGSVDKVGAVTGGEISL